MQHSVQPLRLPIHLIVVALCLAGGLAGCRTANMVTAKLAPPLHQAAEAQNDGVVVSLKELAEMPGVNGDPEGAALSDEVRHLGGMTTAVGFVVDTANQDVLLFGRADKGAVPLRLDDLLVALRCAFMQYSVNKNGKIYYTPPGVSLDPDPAVLDDLRRIERRVVNVRDHAASQKAMAEWSRRAKSPQKTRVLGMPPAHLAAVALDADYQMKRIVDGSLKVRGLRSLTQLRAEARKKQNMPSSSFNRFWFTAGRTDFRSDDGVFLLDTCGITLKTEAELLVSREKVTGSGRADPIAKMFCANFTRLYPEIAKRPVYAELASEFRWVALATMMKRGEAFTKSGMPSEPFLIRLLIERCPIPAGLPGIGNIQEKKMDTAKGARYQWLMTVGGVNLGIRPSDIVVERDQSGALRLMGNAARQARPSRHVICWRIPRAVVP